MRQAAIATLLFTVSMPIVAGASSPWCERPNEDPAQWAAEALRNGDAVFVGRVYSLKPIPSQEREPEPSDNESAESMAELLRLIEEGQARDAEQYDYVVSFEVTRSWKEPVLPIARMKVRLGRLPEFRSFEVGDTYLLVGRELDGTLYQLKNRCIDAIRDEWSAKFQQALDDLSMSP